VGRGQRVAGLGSYEGRRRSTRRAGTCAGFIDRTPAHESSKLLIDEFARLVAAQDDGDRRRPHEIANVLGTDGVHWLCDAAGDLPLDVYFMASSCVPASRFESPRRALSTGDLEGLLRRTHVLGLAEMMNFPGVVSGDEGELAKLRLARHVDGHAPGVTGRSLNAYAAAGIASDHEAATVEEGRERLRAGLWLLIREASSARNLKALLPLALSTGHTGWRSAPTTASGARRRRRAHQRDRP
jgi:adenine deaminase